MVGRRFIKRGRRRGFKAKTAKKLATRGYVQKAIKRNKETKMYNKEVAYADIAYDNARITQVTTIAQGDQRINRDGDSLKAMSLTIRGNVKPINTTRTVYRLAVIQWYDNTAANAPTWADLVENPTTNPEIAVITTLQTDSKFKLLAERIISVPANSSLESEFNQPFSIFIPSSKLAHKVITYESAATTGWNQVYIMETSNVTNASTTEPSAAWACVTKYKDL